MTRRLTDVHKSDKTHFDVSLLTERWVLSDLYRAQPVAEAQPEGRSEVHVWKREVKIKQPF
jgi:hypothetical protein